MASDDVSRNELTLYVPDLRREPIPLGWAREIAQPAIDGLAAWGELDEVEARISAWVNYVDALFAGGEAAYQLRCAWRLVEIRRGELLGPGPGPGARTDIQPRPPVAEVSDVPERTAHRYRLLAEHRDLIEAHLWSTDNPARVTQAQCLAVIREHTPARRDVTLPEDGVGDDRIRLLPGDFRDRLTGLDGSVDLIITDPPYPKEDLALWSDLAKVAAEVLGPRGLLFAWTGQIFLPEVLARLGEHLTYGWTFALMLPGSGARIMGRHIAQGWKPVVAFSTGTWPSGEWGDDVLISPERDKDEYAWKQNAAPAVRLIDRYSAPDGLVVDPFMGVGTFGWAARESGRRFVGVELDGARFRSAERTVFER